MQVICGTCDITIQPFLNKWRCVSLDLALFSVDFCQSWTVNALLLKLIYGNQKLSRRATLEKSKRKQSKTAVVSQRRNHSAYWLIWSYFWESGCLCCSCWWTLSVCNENKNDLSNVQLYNLHHILKKNTFSQKTFQLKSPLPFRLLTILLAGPSLGGQAFGQALVSCLRRWLRALYTSIKRSFTYWISRSTDSALSRSSRFLPSRPWSWSSNVSNSARFLWRYLLKTINTEDIQFYLQKVWSFKSHTQLLCNARRHCSLKHNTILPLSSAFMTKCNFRTPTKFSMLTRLE